MSRILGWILWLALVPGITLSAQDCPLTITGQVLDDHDRTPLAFSSVVLHDPGQGVLADSLGRFEFRQVCAGPVKLTISHLGCEPVTVAFTVRSDTSIVVFAEHHVNLLEAIVKTARRPSEQPSQVRQSMEGEALQRLEGRSLAGMLESLSGVSMVQTGPGIAKPMIHGLSGSRILIVQNGVRQEGQQWGIDHAPEIDPVLAGKLTVIKGAEGIRYGPDALGGVVLVEPDPMPRSPGLAGRISQQLQTNGRGGKLAVRLEGGLGKQGWGWRTVASWRQLGDHQAPDYLLSNTGIREGAMSLAVGRTADRWSMEAYYSLYHAGFGILRAAHIGNTTDLETAIAASEPWFQRSFSYTQLNPRQQVTHHLGKLAGSYRLNARWDLEARYSIQVDDRKEYDIRRGDRDDRPALDLQIISQQLEVLAEHRSWRHWRGGMGLSGQIQANANLPGTGVAPLIPNFFGTTTSIFAWERYLRDAYELEAGVRFDYRFLRVSRFDENDNLVRPEFRFPNVNVSLGGAWHPTSDFALRLHLGSAYRAPGANELFSEGLHHGTAAIELGVDSLNVEQGWKAVLSLHRETGRLRGSISAYAQIINGFIYLRPDDVFALTIRGAFPVFRYTQTDAVLTGVDLDVELDLFQSLTYAGQVSVLQTDDLRNLAPLWGMPPWQFDHQLIWRYPASGRGPDWEARIGVRQVLQQDQAPATDFAPAPPGYTLVRASVGASWPRWRIQLGGENLLNTRYRDYLDRLRYFADAPGRNLTLRCTYQFTSTD